MVTDAIGGHWLPPGKRAAVCMTIDDVHPGRSSDRYEAGGDLHEGALARVEWLLHRHEQLHVTLFITPDWRETSPRPTRKLLASIPYIRDRAYLAPILPKGTMRLDRHPEFVRYISSLPRTEAALHGLHHVHPGLHLPREFQQQDRATCKRMLEDAMEIFKAADMEFVPGITPPAFHAPSALLEAAVDAGLIFVCSARDIATPVSVSARSVGSGRTGLPLIFPCSLMDGQLVHIPTNFQATCSIDRAVAIIENGGLLSIKAHIVKNAMGHIAADGLDDLYRNYLDVLFSYLESRFGDSIWWTSPYRIARQLQNVTG